MIRQLRSVPFYFIRHGQTDWNVAHRAMGVTDIALNETGKLQAENAASLLKEREIACVFSSPLQRALETAETIVSGRDIEIKSVQNLKEFNLGEYAGKKIDTWFDEWMDGMILPEGESYTDFVDRSIQGVNEALIGQKPILIVGHGGTYWSIQRATGLLDLPDLPNCEPVEFIPPTESIPAWQCVPIKERVERT